MPVQADSGPGLPRAFAAHVTNALSDCCGVVAGQAGALGNWLLESVAAVVEVRLLGDRGG